MPRSALGSDNVRETGMAPTAADMDDVLAAYQSWGRRDRKAQTRQPVGVGAGIV